VQHKNKARPTRGSVPRHKGNLMGAKAHLQPTRYHLQFKQSKAIPNAHQHIGHTKARTVLYALD
jgi:hypothetical protein